MDILSGIAYIDGGTLISSDSSVHLIYNGNVIGQTNTNLSGGFSFEISSADLTSGGILLTDAGVNGNTSTSPMLRRTRLPPSISGVGLFACWPIRPANPP